MAGLLNKRHEFLARVCYAGRSKKNCNLIGLIKTARNLLGDTTIVTMAVHGVSNLRDESIQFEECAERRTRRPSTPSITSKIDVIPISRVLAELNFHLEEIHFAAER